MSRSRSARAALSRTVVVLVLVSSVLVGMAGSSLAAAVDEAGPVSAGSVPSGVDIAGLSIGTFSWAVAGFLLLVLGFFAASRSGRRLPAGSAPALTNLGPQSTRGQQGESTSTAVAV